MKAENFVYWLQGYFELSGSDSLTPEQTAMIKKHLSLCLENRTSDESFGGWEFLDTKHTGLSANPLC